MIAAVGVYGLVSFSVGRRVQEFGVRMALGAAPGSIMRLVIGQGPRLALAGIVIGVAGALLMARLMQSLLFEVSATDPSAFVVAMAVLVGAVLAACYSPARRALRVNPVAALTAVLPAEAPGFQKPEPKAMNTAVTPPQGLDWPPIIVALGGIGVGGALLMLTLFIRNSLNRKRGKSA